MACTHERIKSVNCVIFCADCGEKLNVDYLVGKSKIREQEAAKQPAEAQETAQEETKVYAPKKRTTKKGGK